MHCLRLDQALIEDELQLVQDLEDSPHLPLVRLANLLILSPVVLLDLIVL